MYAFKLPFGNQAKPACQKIHLRVGWQRWVAHQRRQWTGVAGLPAKGITGVAGAAAVAGVSGSVAATAAGCGAAATLGAPAVWGVAATEPEAVTGVAAAGVRLQFVGCGQLRQCGIPVRSIGYLSCMHVSLVTLCVP